MPHMANFGIGTRTYGVEIELAGLTTAQAADALRAAGVACRAETYNHDPRPTWKAVPDGSVPGGCEVVSPVLSGPEGFREIETVCAALRAAGATVNRTTGLHVHLGARDLSLDAVKRLLKNWAKFEDTIDLLVAPSRRADANGFCRSIVGRFGAVGSEAERCATIRTAFAKIDAATTLRELFGLFASRYYKLNLEAFWRHGTIEVRQHHGTLDAAKIINWIELMGALFEASSVARSVAVRPVNGQTPKFRFKWLFNMTVQGAPRRFWSRRMRELERGRGAA